MEQTRQAVSPARSLGGLMPEGAVRRFMARLQPHGAHLVVGYSGGADSMALLKALAVVQKKMDYQLIVAHVDHGWRPESSAEADALREQVQGWGLLWESTRLAPPPTSNLEEAARNARLHFFQELVERYNARALLLAHQAEDVVETVLKRLLEGAALDKIHGLRPIHQLKGMTVWRPLLRVSRASIEAYCRRHRLSWLEDPTNEDTSFLRARMRSQLIPEMERLFGKGIRRPLQLLAIRSLALEQRMEQGGSLEELRTVLQGITPSALAGGDPLLGLYP